MSKYERGSGVPFTLVRDDQGGGEKRFNLGLVLPLGGMVVVGIVSLTLGWIFYDRPERDNAPLELPTIEDYQQGRLRDGEMHVEPVRAPRMPSNGMSAPESPEGPDAGPTPLDSGPE